MAITKILFIRARLDDRVAYAANEKKTSLDGSIEYAVNGEKTEQRLYEAAVNCGSPETAYVEMSASNTQPRHRELSSTKFDYCQGMA